MWYYISFYSIGSLITKNKYCPKVVGWHICFFLILSFEVWNLTEMYWVWGLRSKKKKEKNLGLQIWLTLPCPPSQVTPRNDSVDVFEDASEVDILLNILKSSFVIPKKWACAWWFVMGRMFYFVFIMFIYQTFFMPINVLNKIII